MATTPKRKEETTKVTAVKARLLGTLGGLTDRMQELREKKRALQTDMDLVEAEYKALEEQLLEKLKAEGTDKCAGKKASASISEVVTANVTDWAAVEKFVAKTGYFHLFQRRLSDPAYRELLESGKKVPGTEPFTKVKINLRNL